MIETILSEFSIELDKLLQYSNAHRIFTYNNSCSKQLLPIELHNQVTQIEYTGKVRCQSYIPKGCRKVRLRVIGYIN